MFVAPNFADSHSMSVCHHFPVAVAMNVGVYAFRNPIRPLTTDFHVLSSGVVSLFHCSVRVSFSTDPLPLSPSRLDFVVYVVNDQVLVLVVQGAILFRPDRTGMSLFHFGCVVTTTTTTLATTTSLHVCREWRNFEA